MKRKIAILGSTGSIGVSTLDVVTQFPERFEVVGLAVQRNIDLLELAVFFEQRQELAHIIESHRLFLP